MGLFTWYKEKELKRLVAWCATTENNQLRYNFSLYDYLHNAQIKYKVDEKYRLRRDRDGKYAKIILEDFQRFIAQDYFYGRIPYQNSRYSINGEDFFMMYLFIYTAIKQEQYSINGIYIWECNNLTDFGVVLIKMQNISFLYCKNNPIYRSNIAGWLTSERITSVIDSRE